MAKIAKKSKRRPSDLTEEAWEQTAPSTPRPGAETPTPNFKTDPRRELRMQRVLAACSVAVAVALANVAHAEEPNANYSSAYRDCMAKSGEADPAIRECNSAELERLDRALNTVYGKLSAKVQEASRKENLRKAERAWMAFRDSQCGFEASAEAGGSLALIIMGECTMRETYNRTRELSRMLTVEAP